MRANARLLRDPWMEGGGRKRGAGSLSLSPALLLGGFQSQITAPHVCRQMQSQALGKSAAMSQGGIATV